MDENKGDKLKPYTFNVVFEPEATQEDIIEHSGMKRYSKSVITIILEIHGRWTLRAQRSPPHV